MAVDLTWTIASLTENDYDGVAETVKHVIPALNEVNLKHEYFRDNTETDADAKTAIKADLTDKGYVWDTEDGV